MSALQSKQNPNHNSLRGAEGTCRIRFNFQNSRQDWHHSIHSCCLARVDTDCSLQGLLPGLRLGRGSLDWEAELVKELAPDVGKSLIKILQLSLVVAAFS